jgi:hypothetical protein
MGTQSPCRQSPDDPILAFHFKGKDGYIMLKCSKVRAVDQVKIRPRARSSSYLQRLLQYGEGDVLFKLKDGLLIRNCKGRSRPGPESWNEFERWLDGWTKTGSFAEVPASCTPPWNHPSYRTSSGRSN